MRFSLFASLNFQLSGHAGIEDDGCKASAMRQIEVLRLDLPARHSQGKRELRRRAALAAPRCLATETVLIWENG